MASLQHLGLGTVRVETGHAKQIQQAFEQWDTDGSGTISKDELFRVMRELCPMTENEIDILMKEADQNRNGLIEYSEFVNWLTKPAAESYGRAILDYASVLKPLFEVYDVDGSGSISYDDFEECHVILQNSLRLHPLSEAASCGLRFDPMDLQMSAKEAFKQADRTGDNVISFTDFVSWIRDHIDTEGLRSEELRSFTCKVARMLSSIFRLKEMAEDEPDGRLGPDEEQVLERLVKNLADSTRQLGRALSRSAISEEELPGSPGGASTRSKAMTEWSEPPVGLSVERLQRAHMRYAPLNMRVVEKVEFEVLVVPLPEEGSPAEERVWVGEVARKATFRSGRVNSEPPQYYAYRRDSFTWVPLGGSKEFDEALDKLPPELGVFCILKTEANFGVSLRWAGIRKSLKTAVQMDLLTGEQSEKFVSHMEDQVLRTMQSGEFSGSLELQDKPQERAKKLLETRVKLKPREVMIRLTDLKILPPSSVWMSEGSPPESPKGRRA